MRQHESFDLDESLVKSEAGSTEVWVSYIDERRRRIGKSLSLSLNRFQYDLDTGNVYSRNINPEFGTSLLRAAQIIEFGHIADPNMSKDFEESEDCAMILAVGDFLVERGIIDPLPETSEAINE